MDEQLIALIEHIYQEPLSSEDSSVILLLSVMLDQFSENVTASPPVFPPELQPIIDSLDAPEERVQDFLKSLLDETRDALARAELTNRRLYVSQLKLMIENLVDELDPLANHEIVTLILRTLYEMLDFVNIYKNGRHDTP